jgi:hypothetical protein
MARAYTIGFNYRNKCHLAMLSIQQKEAENVPLVVEVFDKNFCKKTIPDGRILFYLKDGILVPVDMKSGAEELVTCISNSVLGHIKVLGNLT